MTTFAGLWPQKGLRDKKGAGGPNFAAILRMYEALPFVRALTLAHGIATYLTVVPFWLGKGEIMYSRLTAAFVFTVALAAPVMADGLFGAISFSPSTGKVGAGWNFASKDEASSDAITRCGVGDCSAVVVFPTVVLWLWAMDLAWAFRLTSRWPRRKRRLWPIARATRPIV